MTVGGTGFKRQKGVWPIDYLTSKGQSRISSRWRIFALSAEDFFEKAGDGNKGNDD